LLKRGLAAEGFQVRPARNHRFVSGKTPGSAGSKVDTEQSRQRAEERRGRVLRLPRERNACSEIWRRDYSLLRTSPARHWHKSTKL
jgi:hypothetical protein